MFDADDLKAAFDKDTKEVMYSQSQVIADTDDKGESVYYIARGIIVEKSGRLEDHQIP